MNLVVGLSQWRVSLRSGLTLDLWADSYSEEGGEFLFGVLADVPMDEQREVRICDRSPDSQQRVVVVLAAIKSDEVAEIKAL